ncbi:drug/metabolite transporter (DMT)-like permease [Caldalkalibacillus uzonensis]|uniref:Drug/metabolite transporter (DMT)-like permease n=1 Tax=Caldalkalibacillus uzonensis TaxID=353224 RepID=A0ABU0CNK0_9BACI|nr:DMT family transporter [Caldalkalibacillus uzonensis]MDQ0337989.1 drug/metabolite transporter (DMT)-like permease [Caldalkalibacillus uzonensis]
MFTYVFLVVVMLIWGLNVVGLKLLVETFAPVTMQAGRIFVAGVSLVIVLYFLKELRRLNHKEWGYTLLATVLGVVVHHALLAVGLAQTSASNAALILGLLPLTTSVLAMIFLHDRLTLLRLLGIVCGFIGVACVVLHNNGGMGSIATGDLLVLLAMVSQAFSFILIKKVTATLSAKEMTAVMLLVGSVMLLALSFWVEPQGLSTFNQGSWWIWLIFFASAIIATGLGHMLFNAAIDKIGAGQAAIFNNLVPFFALISAFLFLGEPIFASQLFGFIFIVAGVLLGTGYVDEKLKLVSLSAPGRNKDSLYFKDQASLHGENHGVKNDSV